MARIKSGHSVTRPLGPRPEQVGKVVWIGEEAGIPVALVRWSFGGKDQLQIHPRAALAPMPRTSRRETK